MAKATKKRKKQRKELLIGLGALGLTLAVLLVLAVGMPQLTPVPPAVTEPTTEPTLPPPEANPYGPTDFQYDGWYLTCTAGESVLGIDVSKHQQEIDWNAVADAGIEFVMIRAGNRGLQTGELFTDPYALANYQGAKDAGLKVGVYLFSQALTVAEAEEEARFLLNIIDGWELDMPVVFDWEIAEDGRTAAMDKRTLTDCTIAFCEIIKAEGYTPMIYFNRSQGNRLLHLEELTQYGFWLALYNDRMTYPYKIDMWQYTCEGRVPGIEGDVDINLWFPE